MKINVITAALLAAGVCSYLSTYALSVSAPDAQLHFSQATDLHDTETIALSGNSYYMSGSHDFSITNTTGTELDFSQIPLNILFSNVPAGEVTPQAQI